MKKTFVRLMAFFAPMVPLTLAAQTYSQPIPDNITEIRVEDNARVMVTEGADATIASATNERVATVKGSRMLVSDNVNATITLPAGRPFTVVAEDHSQVVFQGSFGKSPSFTVRSEDYASVTFSGSRADTLRTTDLNLRADDYSRINSDIVISSLNFNFQANDYAAINLACKNKHHSSGTGTIHINDKATIDFNICSGDTTTPFDATATHLVPVKAQSGTSRKPSFWRRRDVALNFAWGFHNWGSEPLGGFSGVDGPANVRTSFNHIHLSVDFPLVGTRHTGLYIGLGLDWDKYKFTTPEITFDPASATFDQGTTQDPCSSRSSSHATSSYPSPSASTFSGTTGTSPSPHSPASTGAAHTQASAANTKPPTAKNYRKTKPSTSTSTPTNSTSAPPSPMNGSDSTSKCPPAAP